MKHNRHLILIVALQFEWRHHHEDCYFLQERPKRRLRIQAGVG